MTDRATRNHALAEREKRLTLAAIVVESWDLETLIEFAVQTLALETYVNDPTAYDNDLRDFENDTD